MTTPDSQLPKTVQLPTRTLAYTEASPANLRGTVLLLPWLGGSRLGWSEVQAELGTEYRVLAPDHRDTGDSSPDAATAIVGALKELRVNLRLKPTDHCAARS